MSTIFTDTNDSKVRVVVGDSGNSFAAQIALRGMPGRDGEPGLNGGELYKYEFVATSNGEQALTLPRITSAIYATHINGLLQQSGHVSVSGALVSIPASLEVMAGDQVVINYY